MDNPTKVCGRCKKEKGLGEFGSCTSRPDGLNLYCKQCNRTKTAQTRQVEREWKANARLRWEAAQVQAAARGTVKPKHLPDVSPSLSTPGYFTPSERVREAIRAGAHTQKAIEKLTKLHIDELGDAIANLLLWTNEIRTRVINGRRFYFLNEPAKNEAPTPIARDAFDASPFALCALPPVMHGSRF